MWAIVCTVTHIISDGLLYDTESDLLLIAKFLVLHCPIRKCSCKLQFVDCFAVVLHDIHLYVNYITCRVDIFKRLTLR